MIKWIEYDPANPPQSFKDYFVISSGTHPWCAYLDSRKGWMVGNVGLNNVTHYAHINLPGEEDK
ncbi:hypothetical protein BK146_17885 [Paenibacillus sp. FSL R7-0333]|nr:hypothetical protein BK146_17885 [Paenibacillus sp. FSL R7-0333]